MAHQVGSRNSPPGWAILLLTLFCFGLLVWAIATH